jgi:hypothetical protein
MWFNPIMRYLLRSPLHGLAGKQTLLIGYRGCKSGKFYETPVNFVREGGDILVTSRTERTWWRNLRQEAPVTLWLDGKSVQAMGKAYTSPGEVTRYLNVYLQHRPGIAKYFDVGLDENGLPRPEEVTRAASQRVIVRLRLSE